ncbi:hypothetical protein SGLAM104S_05890 [Streptomyces glaucescens]
MSTAAARRVPNAVRTSSSYCVFVSLPFAASHVSPTNSRCSSRAAPDSTGTRWKRPSLRAFSGSSGRTPSPKANAWKMFMTYGTSRIRSTGSARRQRRARPGSGSAQPSPAATSRPESRSSRWVRQVYQRCAGTCGPIIPAGMSIMPSPLESTARWNRPRAAGEAR